MQELTTHPLFTDAQWGLGIALALQALAALVTYFRGAQLVRVLIPLALLPAGGLAGFVLHSMSDYSLPVCTTVGAVAAGIAGIVFSRFWVALLCAGYGAVAAVLVFAAPQLVAVAKGAADTLRASPPSVTSADQSGVLSWLSARSGEISGLASAQLQLTPTSTFLAIGVAALAAFLVAWRFPRLAVAGWAATTGTVGLILSTNGLLAAYWPTGFDQLAALGTWSWGIVAAMWAVSLVINLQKPRPALAAAPAERDPAIRRAPA